MEDIKDISEGVFEDDVQKSYSTESPRASVHHMIQNINRPISKPIGRRPADRKIQSIETMSTQDRISDIRCTTRARYVIQSMNRIALLRSSPPQDITRIVIFLIICGHGGRAMCLEKLEELLPEQCLRGLIHLERNMSREVISISFFGEPEANFTNRVIETETVPVAGKIAAILLKSLLAYGSGIHVYERARDSMGRLGGSINLTNACIVALEPICQGDRMSVMRSMLVRSQLLLACAYAHYDGSLRFARNTASMADNSVRKEVLSGKTTKLIYAVKGYVYTGAVPSVYFCWVYLIPPYQV